jgi:hypothetical protein
VRQPAPLRPPSWWRTFERARVAAGSVVRPKVVTSVHYCPATKCGRCGLGARRAGLTSPHRTHADLFAIKAVQEG